MPLGEPPEYNKNWAVSIAKLEPLVDKHAQLQSQILQLQGQNAALANTKAEASYVDSEIALLRNNVQSVYTRIDVDRKRINRLQFINNVQTFAILCAFICIIIIQL